VQNAEPDPDAPPFAHATGLHRTVPFQAREEWTRAVETAVLNVLTAIAAGEDQGILDAFDRLLRLPSEVLPDSRASRGFTRRLCARLSHHAAGEPIDVPDAGDGTRHGLMRARDTLHKQAARAHRQLTLGNVSRAAKCIQAAPLAETTEATMAALRALHPSAPPPPLPAPTAAAVVVSLDVLSDVMSALPKGSAPGPSGWTYEMIKLATQTTNSALGAVLALINAIVGGKLPHVPCLLDSTLLGFEKPGGNGIRPIAIGEVWLRLAGLCAMAACPGAGQALAPLQLGVGVKGGSQILGHAIRTGVAADPSCVTIQLDFRNAYNTLGRGPALAAITKKQPSLALYANWVYRQRSRLFAAGAPAGTPPVWSECGLRQGETTSGLFFGVTLQEPLEQISLTHPDVKSAAYLDDVFQQGSPAAAIAAFPALCHLCAAIGLHVNPDKCGVYSPDAQAAADVAAALGIRHCESGLMVAGTPVGTDAFITAHVNAKADAVSECIDAVLETPLPAQDKFMILRASAQMRTAHLPRVVPWRLVGDAIQRTEAKVAEAAFQIMERPQQGGTSAAQMTLPLRHGGMGIRATTELEGDASFLSAAAIAETAFRDGVQQFRPFAGPDGPRLERIWQTLHAAGAASALWPPDALAVNTERIDKVMPDAQRVYARFVAQGRSDALLAACDAAGAEGQRDRARLLSCQCRAASAWIDTLPTAPALRMSNADFVCAMRHRLGLTHMPANAPGVQCSCGQFMQPNDVDHAMTCKSQCGAMQLRHEIIKDTWRLIANRAGVASSVEPVLRRLPGAQASANANRPDSRGDILLVLPGGLTVADVSVVHPAASTYVQAARSVGGAAAARDQAKRVRYATADPNGYAFIPLSVETFGRMGKPAMELLNTLATAAAAGGAVQKTGFVVNALRQLSVSLCRGNGIMYRRSLSVLARASGTSFLPGLMVPTADIP
jgi:hypothetical protein